MRGDLPSTSRPSHSVTLSPFTPDERALSILHAASPPRPASSQPLRQPRAAHSHLHRDGSLPRDCRLCRLRRPLASPCSRDRRKDRQTGGRNDARGGGGWRWRAGGRTLQHEGKEWPAARWVRLRWPGNAVLEQRTRRRIGLMHIYPVASIASSCPARPRLPPLAVLGRRAGERPHPV